MYAFIAIIFFFTAVGGIVVSFFQPVDPVAIQLMFIASGVFVTAGEVFCLRKDINRRAIHDRCKTGNSGT